jgi:sugar phosphate isomerase/epimerase
MAECLRKEKRLFLSTSCIMTENIVEDIMKISEITGNIELSGGSQQEPYLLGNLKKLKEKKDISFLIHNYFPPPKNNFVLNIANTNDVTRGFIKETMEYVRGLEIDYYSIHSGFTRDLDLEDELLSTNPRGKQYTLEGIYENVEWFRNEFPETKLALENMHPGNNNEENIFLGHIDRIIDILENSEEIYLLLDLGHLKISSVILDFDFNAAVQILLDKYIDRILEIHLSENEGLCDDHNLILSDSLQYKMIKDNAKNILQQEINVTLEARGQSFEDIRENYLLIEEILSA